MEMETRTCACNCGTEFRVGAGSAQRYASLEHEAGVTPGGMAAVLHRNGNHAGRQPHVIRPDQHGLVSTPQLCKILHKTAGWVSRMRTAGNITPVDPSKKWGAEWDLDQVRAQLGHPSEPMPPSRHKVYTATTQEEPEMNENDESQVNVTEEAYEPETRPDAPATAPSRQRRRKKEETALAAPNAQVEIAEAFTAARTAFRKRLRGAAARAAEAGDTDAELALLRMYAHCGRAFDVVSSELTGAGVH